jgi:Tetratricopeptide repeat
MTAENGLAHALIARREAARQAGVSGNAGEAVKLYEQLLPDTRRVFGPNHRETLTIRQNIAYWTRETGRIPEALQIAQALLPDMERVFGRNHQHTLRLRNDIALWTIPADRRLALRRLQELLTDVERVYGDRHPHTHTTRRSIDMLKRKAKVKDRWPSKPLLGMAPIDHAIDPLLDPKLRLDWAFHCHMQSLVRELGQFSDRRPYRVFQEIDPKTNDVALKFQVTEPLPYQVRLFTGDAIHNIRTALDLLACCLAIKNGHSDVGKTAFPFWGSEAKFKKNSVGPMSMLSDPMRKAIWNLKPYPEGDAQLWGLHEIDIASKHRAIVPVWSAAGHSFKVSGGHFNVTAPIDLGPKWGIVKDEAVTLFSMGPGGSIPKMPEVEIAIDVSFSNVGPFANQPVKTVLWELLQKATDIVLDFERKFFSVKRKKKK